ncbi:MAG: FAD-dependent oxidoreductase [Longimicrobiales bacterium]
MDLHSVRDVVILGAGPVGLDAGLAAAEAGLDFRILEQGKNVGANIRQWGHVELFSPWPLNLSGRMEEALASIGAPVPTEGSPTGHEFVDQLLEPIASLLEGQRVHGAKVVSVGRSTFLKHEEIGTGVRAQAPFRVFYEARDGREHAEYAHTVLDCTGTWSQPNWLGPGGTPALGERRCSGIIRHVPDFEKERADWAGRRILVFGAGHSAFTAIRGLADIAASHRGTRVTWVLRSASPSFTTYDDDPLPSRSALVSAAALAAGGEVAGINALKGWSVHSIDSTIRAMHVGIVNSDGEQQALEADRVLALIGSVGDRSLFEQLQIHECYATQGPMKLAATLLAAGGGADCLAQESHGVDVLANPEPNFFILGSKSYGRNSSFLLKVGYDQVTEVFAALPQRGTAAA